MSRMGIRGPRRPGAHGALGRRPDDVPRPADPRLPQPLLPRRARTRRPATTPATTATRSTSSPTCWSTPATRGCDVVEVTRRVRGALDADGRQGRGEDPVRHDRPVRRRQHPRQAASATCSTPAAARSCSRRSPEVVDDRLRGVRAVEVAGIHVGSVVAARHDSLSLIRSTVWRITELVSVYDGRARAVPCRAGQLLAVPPTSGGATTSLGRAGRRRGRRRSPRQP